MWYLNELEDNICKQKITSQSFSVEIFEIDIANRIFSIYSIHINRHAIDEFMLFL